MRLQLARSEKRWNIKVAQVHLECTSSHVYTHHQHQWVWESLLNARANSARLARRLYRPSLLSARQRERETRAYMHTRRGDAEPRHCPLPHPLARSRPARTVCIVGAISSHSPLVVGEPPYHHVFLRCGAVNAMGCAASAKRCEQLRISSLSLISIYTYTTISPFSRNFTRTHITISWMRDIYVTHARHYPIPRQTFCRKWDMLRGWRAKKRGFIHNKRCFAETSNFLKKPLRLSLSHCYIT